MCHKVKQEETIYVIHTPSRFRVVNDRLIPSILKIDVHSIVMYIGTYFQTIAIRYNSQCSSAFVKYANLQNNRSYFVID